MSSENTTCFRIRKFARKPPWNAKVNEGGISSLFFLMNREQMGKMTAYKGTFLNNPVSLKLL
jgi:hypothetical protein